MFSARSKACPSIDRITQRFVLPYHQVMLRLDTSPKFFIRQGERARLRIADPDMAEFRHQLTGGAERAYYHASSITTEQKTCGRMLGGRLCGCASEIALSKLRQMGARASL